MTGQRDFADVIKLRAMRQGFFWLFQGGSLITRFSEEKGRKGRVRGDRTEAEVRHKTVGVRSQGPWAASRKWKCEETLFPKSLWKACSRADILAWALRGPFQTCDLKP